MDTPVTLASIALHFIHFFFKKMWHFSCPQYLFVLHVKQCTKPNMSPNTHMGRLWWFFSWLTTGQWLKDAFTSGKQLESRDVKIEKKMCILKLIKYSLYYPKVEFCHALFLRFPQILVIDKWKHLLLFQHLLSPQPHPITMILPFLPTPIIFLECPFLSLLSYCKNLLTYLLAFEQFLLLQSIPFITPTALFLLHESECIILLLKTLPSVPIIYRIKYKLLSLTFNFFYILASVYCSSIIFIISHSGHISLVFSKHALDFPPLGSCI